ncbi:hypothetical protein IQ270_07745 [Microcoleus sp. LEGE 07076]|uniref:hypothetical protein n=1 Tax=Microcoleus sp. LEGE 07076 TaxID=915322 RepID=UPI0018815632|nr:hypothetical protein [Microcoleus sp. LEGE 07076]MBE9184615.1 hypothetical protein [Microcoleus sp. LEGE 07076]
MSIALSQNGRSPLRADYTKIRAQRAIVRAKLCMKGRSLEKSIALTSKTIDNN